MQNPSIAAPGLALIRKWEGFSALPYLCPAGWLTVGYGHAIRPGEDFSAGVSAEAAMALLRRDLAKVESAIARLIAAPLSQNQFDALASFTFNLGAGALQRSALRRCINRGETAEAAGEFSRWVFAGGRKLRGLVLRRAEEAKLFGLG